MAKYILLINWTDQGIKAVKESANRLDAAKKLIASGGGSMVSFFLTMGAYDQVAIVDAPDDATVAANNLRISAGGNVRMTTLKAFTEDEYRKIIAGL